MMDCEVELIRKVVLSHCWWLKLMVILDRVQTTGAESFSCDGSSHSSADRELMLVVVSSGEVEVQGMRLQALGEAAAEELCKAAGYGDYEA
ncbi:hypothetical protein C5167_023260 [Papaver somniferum]|uniref:Uncharacterized protein n=1 Tax=Papaver somniferum TaxID=3469 RepID=A0A4Y7JNA4_PAPSO|nr:hypothetical protein C5167_023260 [Papaver somniferum]